MNSVTLCFCILAMAWFTVYPPLEPVTEVYNEKAAIRRAVYVAPARNEVLPGADLTLIAQVIHAEARGEPFAGKVAVGAVVMNRVRDHSFPATVREVIEQPGQFAVSSGTSPPGECYEAARAALSGKDPTNGALYFYNRKTVSCSWIRSREVVAEIGNHTFAR